MTSSTTNWYSVPCVSPSNALMTGDVPLTCVPFYCVVSSTHVKSAPQPMLLP